MHKSWSVSYSYTDNGSKVSEVVHKSHDDGVNTYEDGYSREKDKELKEKFYKIKKNKNEKKTLLGKSKNKQDWELLGEMNGNRQNKKEKYVDLSKKFIDRPSTKHRLKNNVNDLVHYNQSVELDNMFKNLNMFDDDDFFKL